MVEDVETMKDEAKKMDELWKNYCGMPICFDMKEFVIVTRLRCYPSSEPLPIVTPLKIQRQTGHLNQPRHQRKTIH